MSIQYGLPMRDYAMMRGFSSGVAWRVITQSPFHARHSQTAPREDVSVANIGIIAHQILLENSEDGIAIIDADDWRKKEAKALRDAAYADGKTPILAHKMDYCRGMVQSARNFIEMSELAGVFDQGAAEVTLNWDDDGLPCKIRPDWLNGKWHLSLKTTDGSARPESWVRRQLTPMGYAFNLAFYRRGIAANGIDVDHRILTIEQNPPYGCCLTGLAPSLWEIAERQVERAIMIWKRCKKNGTYPGYPTRTTFAEAAPWEISQEEEAMLSDPFTEEELENGIPL